MRAALRVRGAGVRGSATARDGGCGSFHRSAVVGRGATVRGHAGAAAAVRAVGVSRYAVAAGAARDFSALMRTALAEYLDRHEHQASA